MVGGESEMPKLLYHTVTMTGYSARFIVVPVPKSLKGH